MRLDDLIQMPWSWLGPTEVPVDEGGPCYELRIAELPDFFVAGETREEVYAEAPEALRSFLLSYLERNEVPPLPGGWERPAWRVWIRTSESPTAEPRLAETTANPRWVKLSTQAV